MILDNDKNIMEGLKHTQETDVVIDIGNPTTLLPYINIP